MIDLSFKPLEPKDLEHLQRWFQEPKVNQFFAENRNWTLKALQKKYLPRIEHLEKISCFMIECAQRPIGLIQSYSLDAHLPEGIAKNSKLFDQFKASTCAGIDLFIAEAPRLTPNLSSLVLNQFIHSAAPSFDAWLLDPDIRNHQAIYCFTKAGFFRTHYSHDPNHCILLKTRTQPSIHLDLLANHPEVIPDLAKIWITVLGKPWLPQVKLEQVIKKFETHLKHQNLPLSLVAFQDGIPVGCVALRTTEGIRPELSPWLASLIVDPAYQGKKIAHLLIDAIKLKAKYLGFEKLYLLCFDPTLPHFYARFDFKIFGHEKLLGLPAKLMECEL